MIEKKIKTSVCIEVPQAIIDELTQEAKDQERSFSRQVILALKKYLPKESVVKDETIVKTHISLRIDEGMLNKIDTIGHNNGTSRGQVVAKFLKDYFDSEDTR